MYVVIFVMFLWLRSSSFVAAKTLFAMGERNLDLIVPVVEDRRKKLFWNIEDGIYLFLHVLGREVWLFFGKEVGHNEEDFDIWNIPNSPALTALIFLGINRILLLCFMSLLAHIPSFSPSFFFWHFYCSTKGFGIEIKVFGVGLLWDLKQMM